MAARAAAKRAWWRWLLGSLLGLSGLLVLAVCGLQTPWAREQLRQQVNHALSPLFAGRIQIDRIGHAGLWGARGVDARIYDPTGAQVIRVQGLDAVAFLPDLVYQLVAHGDAPHIDIALVQVDHADVTLREDQELGLTLATTFLPRATKPSAPETPEAAGPLLTIQHITFERIWAHGRVAGSPALDADLSELVACLSQSSVDGFWLDLERAQLVSRAMPLSADPRGTVTGHIEVPQRGDRKMRLEGTLDGRAAGSPLAAEVVWVGDDLSAYLALPRLPTAFVNEQTGLALEGEVSLLVEVDGQLPELNFDAVLDANAAHVSASGYAFVADGLELGANLAASRVDLAGLSPGAPGSDLGLTSRAQLFEGEDASYEGAYRVELGAGKLAAQETPATWLAGELRLSDERGLRANGQLLAAEPGAPVRGLYRVELGGSAPSRVALALGAVLDEPPRLAAYDVKATGTLLASAELEPDKGRFSAKARLSLNHLDARGLQARNVELQARAAGPFNAPRASAATTIDLLSGRVHADLDYAPERLQLSVFAADIDVLRLARAFDTQLPFRQGTLSADLQLSRVGRAPFELSGKAGADLGKIGSVELVADRLELPSGSPTLARLAQLRGGLSAKGKLDLAEVSPLLLRAGYPIERTTGRLRFELQARQGRNAAEGLELTAQLDSNGLRIVQQRKSQQELANAPANAEQPLSLEGIDLHLSVHARPKSGEALGTLLLRDHGGTLAEIQAEAQIAELWRAQRVDVAALERMPLKVSVEVPRRKLQSLPPLLRPAVMRGRIALAARLEGSVAEPDVTASFSAAALRAPGSKQPLDVEGAVAYTRQGGHATLLARRASGAGNALDFATEWQGDLRRLPEQLTKGGVLVASAKAKLDDFPLDVVPAIADSQVQGRLSGDLSLSDWGKQAQFQARLRSNSLNVAKVAIESFSAEAHTDADRLRAEVSLRSGGGSSRAELDAAMSWGSRAVPQLERRGVAKLSTHAFRLETLSPLLGAYVSELSGLLDAETELAVTPSTTSVSGQAKLERGVVQVPALGQRFSDVTARVAVRDGQFKLERLDARGLTGRLSVTGGARLDGFELRGADAKLVIKKNEKLPITLEGADIGEAWGTVKVTYASPAKGQKRLDIDVPEFQLITPETSGYGLQSLEEPKDVRIGVRRSDGAFVPLLVQPLEAGGRPPGAPGEAGEPLLVQIKLGNVTVERGRTATAQLTGRLSVEVAAETRVNGRIEVRGGKLDVSGKTFEIERGVVTFEGKDPGNPTITATARWDAPEYTVYADYVGDVENGRIKLRSEPPLTRDEIASLLLFGSPEGSPTGGDANGAALAVSVAGDSAAKGLNQVLDDFTNLDVSARIDTTTGNARPELVYQVSPRVAAKVTRAIGAPAAGESPDRTFLTLELRLRRAWALSAVLGDHGASALDLIWRRRY